MVLICLKEANYAWKESVPSSEFLVCGTNGSFGPLQPVLPVRPDEPDYACGYDDPNYRVELMEVLPQLAPVFSQFHP